MNAMYGIGGMGTFECSRYYDLMIMYPKTGSTFVGSSDGSLQLGPEWYALKK